MYKCFHSLQRRVSINATKVEFFGETLKLNCCLKLISRIKMVIIKGIRCDFEAYSMSLKMNPILKTKKNRVMRTETEENSLLTLTDLLYVVMLSINNHLFPFNETQLRSVYAQTFAPLVSLAPFPHVPSNPKFRRLIH